MYLIVAATGVRSMVRQINNKLTALPINLRLLSWTRIISQLNACYMMLRSWALSPIFRHFLHFILHSRSLILHSFPYAPLGPPPNHLTSHLMDHLTIPQSTITCHHSAVRSTLQYHHLTLHGLPAHDVPFLDRQLMMELYLEPPRHDLLY